MGKIISKRIGSQHIERLRHKKPAEMLPAAKLPKIENDSRAVRWMINEFAKRRHPALQELPRILSDWETLVALIDLELGACEYKLSMLQRMELTGPACATMINTFDSFTGLVRRRDTRLRGSGMPRVQPTH